MYLYYKISRVNLKNGSRKRKWIPFLGQIENIYQVLIKKKKFDEFYE